MLTVDKSGSYVVTLYSQVTSTAGLAIKEQLTFSIWLTKMAVSSTDWIKEGRTEKVETRLVNSNLKTCFKLKCFEDGFNCFYYFGSCMCVCMNYR